MQIFNADGAPYQSPPDRLECSDGGFYAAEIASARVNFGEACVHLAIRVADDGTGKDRAELVIGPQIEYDRFRAALGGWHACLPKEVKNVIPELMHFGAAG